MKPRHDNHLAILIGLSFLLTACGFQPLYSHNGSAPAVQAELAAIAVEVKENRLDRLVYSSLVDQLTPLGAPASPAYHLEITLEAIHTGVGFEEDDSVTRFNFQLLGTWRLIDTESRKVLFQSASRSIAAYNVVTSQFATLTAEKDAEERAAVDLAQDVRLQLSLHFRQFPGAVIR